MMSLEPEEVVEEHPIITIAKETILKEAHKIAKAVNREVYLKIRTTLEAKGLLRKLKPASQRICGVSVDTGFTDPPMELTGGKLITILRAHVFFGCNPKTLPKADTVGFVKFVSEYEDIAKIYSKIIERKFIVNTLEKVVKGHERLDTVILDGELFPRIPPGYISPSKRKEETIVTKLYNKYLELTDQLLKLADKTDVSLVGVIKRAYGIDLPVICDTEYTKINDKALATYILKPGEWIDIGPYAELALKIEKYAEKRQDILPKNVLRRLQEREAWIVRVIDAIEQTSDIEVALYKAPTPTYFMLATKVEIWNSMKMLKENILNFIASLTGINGVPHPIDLVDSMCRVRVDTLQVIQQQLFTELNRILKDEQLALSLAGLTNPEKMYKIGFK